MLGERRLRDDRARSRRRAAARRQPAAASRARPSRGSSSSPGRSGSGSSAWSSARPWASPWGSPIDVDPVRCEFDDNYVCSRGEAVARRWAGPRRRSGPASAPWSRGTSGCPWGSTPSGRPRPASAGRASAARASRRRGAGPVGSLLRKEGRHGHQRRGDRTLGKSLALVAACVLSCACATTRYTQSRIETVPSDVKGHAGSRASVEIEGLKIRIESLDRTPRGGDDPAPLAAARVRAARARVFLRPGAGRPAGLGGGEWRAGGGGLPAALPGLGLRSRLRRRGDAGDPADLVLGGLARGPKRARAGHAAPRPARRALRSTACTGSRPSATSLLGRRYASLTSRVRPLDSAGTSPHSRRLEETMNQVAVGGPALRHGPRHSRRHRHHRQGGPGGPPQGVRRVRGIPARPRFRPRGRPRRYRASSSSPKGRGDTSGRSHRTTYRSARTSSSRTQSHGTAACATGRRSKASPAMVVTVAAFS